MSSGEGGSFEMRNGQRVQTQAPGKPHPDGDRPRDADGKPINPPAQDPNASALPQPGPAPWDAPAAPSTTEAAPVQAPRSKRGE